MRTSEILALATLLLALLSFFVPRHKRPRWMAHLSSLAVLFVLIHLALEGYRWQMVPAYGLTAILFLGTVHNILRGPEAWSRPLGRWRRALTIVGVVLGLSVLVLAAALPVLFPVRRLQELTESDAGKTRIRPSDGMVIVYVPAGEFEMGTGGLQWLRLHAVSGTAI